MQNKTSAVPQAIWFWTNVVIFLFYRKKKKKRIKKELNKSKNNLLYMLGSFFLTFFPPSPSHWFFTPPLVTHHFCNCTHQVSETCISMYVPFPCFSSHNFPKNSSFPALIRMSAFHLQTHSYLPTSYERTCSYIIFFLFLSSTMNRSPDFYFYKATQIFSVWISYAWAY